MTARSFTIEPVRTTRTFEAVIEHLAEAIERAHLAPVDRLPGEGALAEALGISKPTLRQALRVLEHAVSSRSGAARRAGSFSSPSSPGRRHLRRGEARGGRRDRDAPRPPRARGRCRGEAAQTATDADHAELERAIDLLERHLGDRRA